MKRNSPMLLRKLGARLFSNSPPILSPSPSPSPSRGKTLLHSLPSIPLDSLTTVSDRDVIYTLSFPRPSWTWRIWMSPLINRSAALRNLRRRLFSYLHWDSDYEYWRDTPSPWIDKASSWIIRTLLYPTQLLLQRCGCRVVMLETLVAVPGTVANLLRHLQSTMQQMELGGDWTKSLLQEAGKESLQLKNFMEGFNFKPMLYERAVMHSVQAVFFNIYMLAYLLFPRMAHRMVGHLKEYAVHSYTEFLKAIEPNRIGNAPAPAIAIDYWRLGLNATLRDAVMAIRAEEADYRDMNQFERWMAEHGRGYKNAAAKQHRFKIFQKTLRSIESHNARSLGSREGLNKFSNLTMEEFHHTYCGAGVPESFIAEILRENPHADVSEFSVIGEPRPHRVQFRTLVCGVEVRNRCGRRGMRERERDLHLHGWI